jgi:hypothetical protein
MKMYKFVTPPWWKRSFVAAELGVDFELVFVAGREVHHCRLPGIVGGI